MIRIKERRQEAARKILELINSQTFKTECLISRPVFVICGVSGSGKTSAIELVNEQQPEGEEVAESRDILFCKDADSAQKIIDDDESQYAWSKYIAYSTVHKSIAQELAKNGRTRVIFVE